MPPRPSRATIRYRSMRTVPGENPPLRGGCELGEADVGLTAGLSGSRVGASRMATARPHEEQKPTLSEDTAPQPEQVTMRTDCTAPRDSEPHGWIRRALANRSRVTACPLPVRPVTW